MKALHVFPQFSPESINGSERYEYMLSRKLVELGVEVDILTTTTKDFLPLEPFSLRWPDQYKELTTVKDGITIKRFPATFHLPEYIGHLLSRRMIKRWQWEEDRYGLMVKGSRNLIDYYYARAIKRPRIYDVTVTLGRGPFSGRLMLTLWRTMRRYDAIQVGFAPFALTWQVVALARLLRKPVVVLALFHPEDVSHHFRTIYWSLSAADAILAQTPYSVAVLKRLFPGSGPVDIGAGVELEAFTDQKACGARFRAKYGLLNKRIALFVGRKEPLKRYDLAIAAIEMIDDDRIQLVMIGRDIDRRPIASPRVSYLGEVSHDDLADAYDGCDVFVLPSENESFGIVFLEAWARRKPVVGNRFCGPVASLIQNGENGFLCADAVEIAAAIVRLIADPALAHKMGQAGFERVIRRYTWDVIAGRVQELYSQLAARDTSQQ
jgi:glycosyltransferase involved in cell wall biosynthesis